MGVIDIPGGQVIALPGLPSGYTRTTTNLGPQTIYYDVQPNVGPSRNAGSLAQGQSVTVSTGLFVVSPSGETQLDDERQSPLSGVSESSLWVSLKMHGAKGDTIHGSAGTSIGAQFSDPGASWTASDVGKTIIIQASGAALSDGFATPFQTTIAGFTSGTSITLAANPTVPGGPVAYAYGTDDSAAIAAAVAAVGIDGTIFAPAGDYMCATTNVNPNTGLAGGGVSLTQGGAAFAAPRSATGWRLLGAGAGVTNFTLSPNCPRLVDCNRIADYDTFQNITIEHFSYDGQNVTGYGHTLFGTVIGGAPGTQHRLNFNRIRLRHIVGRNVAYDPANTNASQACVRSHVNITLVQLANGEGTQNTGRDIQVTDLQLTGGAFGVVVNGYIPAVSTGGGNILLDKVTFENCSHDTGFVYGATGVFQFSASFQAGQQAAGGKLRIRNCHGANTVDVGIEIDNWDDALIEGCEMTDICGPAYLLNNFTAAPSGGANQHITFRDCDARYVNLPDTQAATWAPAGFRIGGDSAAWTNQVVGHVALEDCSWHKPSKQKLVQGECIYANMPGAAVGIHSLTIKGFKMVMDGAALASQPSTGQKLCWIVGQTPTASFARINIRDFYVHLDGQVTTASVLELRPFGLGGVGDFTIDGLYNSISLTLGGGASAPVIVMMTTGQDTSSNLRGVIRGFRNLQGVGIGTPIAITFENNLTIANVIRVEDSDFSNVTTPFFFGSAAKQAGVTYANNRLPGSSQPERWPAANSFTMVGYEENVAVTDTTAARTITMPAIAAIYPGRRFVVYDESNGAVTHNITVACAGADTFTDATTSKVISANGGSVSFRSTGTKWAVV